MTWTAIAFRSRRRRRRFGAPTYTYDPGNANSPGVDELTAVGSTLYQYTSDGRLDCRGLTVTSCPSGSDSFRWDGYGRIQAATVSGRSVCYRYDPTGALLSRVYDSTGSASCSSATATTNYLLGDLVETNAAGAITASYQDGPEGELALFTGPPSTASTVSYLYYSGHGDLAAEADASGSRTAAHSYGPFGTPNDPPPANSTSHRYTGEWDKQYDSTSSLILMGARPYDPTIGRFLAADPIDGGSLNNYDSAGQDPINGYDLSGLMLQAEHDTGGGVQGDLCGPLGTDSCAGTEGNASDWTSGDGGSSSGGSRTWGLLALDLGAVACTVVTDGGCLPAAYAAISATLADSAARNHIGSKNANYARFGVDVALALGTDFGTRQLDAFAEYLKTSGAGGSRVVRAIYGGLVVTYTHIVGP